MADDKELVTEITSQIRTLENRRTAWEPLWKEVMEFCFPSRNFDPIKDQAKAKAPKVNYNNRAALDVNVASAGFLGYTANRRQIWCKLQFEDLGMMKKYKVADWLEECERILFAAFSRFGLYEALSEIVPDGHTIGTGTLYIEDLGKGRIAYQPRHPMSVWIAENAAGEIDTIAEDIPFFNKAAVQRFGEDKVSDRMREAAKKDPFGMTTVRHVVFPKDERYKALASKMSDNRMAYTSIWIDTAEGMILDTGGYWELPHAVWRYRKNAGEEYGRSPAQDALGDIMAGNQMTRSRIRLGNLIADPTLLIDEGLEGQDTIVPGHHIYRSKRDDMIEPVQVGANYPITKDNEERQDQLIDAHFNVPIYLMLQQMERQMTAREVIERTGEKAAILGPISGRYEREVLQKVVRRTFNILMRNNMMPPAPDVIMQQGGQTPIKIEFLGFLAQLQQRYYQTTGINATVEYVAAVGQLFPEATDWVDADKLMVEGMESAGSPASVVREEDDVKKLRAMRQQAMAQQQQQAMEMQEQQAIVQNADKLGQKPQPGSPLDNMGEMLAKAQAGAV